MTCHECTFWHLEFDKAWARSDFGQCTVVEGQFSSKKRIHILTFDDCDLLTRQDFYCADFREKEEGNEHLSLDRQGK